MVHLSEPFAVQAVFCGTRTMQPLLPYRSTPFTSELVSLLAVAVPTCAGRPVSCAATTPCFGSSLEHLEKHFFVCVFIPSRKLFLWGPECWSLVYLIKQRATFYNMTKRRKCWVFESRFSKFDDPDFIWRQLCVFASRVWLTLSAKYQQPSTAFYVHLRYFSRGNMDYFSFPFSTHSVINA